MSATSTPTSPPRSRLKFWLRLGTGLTAIYLFRRAILRGLFGVLALGVIGYAVVSYKHPSPTPEQVQAAADAAEARRVQASHPVK